MQREIGWILSLALGVGVGNFAVRAIQSGWIGGLIQGGLASFLVLVFYGILKLRERRSSP